MNDEVMVIIIVALILSYSLARFKLKVRGGSSARRHETEETELVQDIHRQLEGIEQRVEALETILLEREPRRKSATFQNE